MESLLIPALGSILSSTDSAKEVSKFPEWFLRFLHDPDLRGNSAIPSHCLLIAIVHPISTVTNPLN